MQEMQKFTLGTAVLAGGKSSRMEQGSIGCEHRLEPLFVSHPHELRQQRMEQRLAHQVEIEEAHLVPHPIRDEIELLCTQLPLLAMMLGAEIAIQIAGIGYFDVTAVYHIFYFIINSKSSYLQRYGKK